MAGQDRCLASSECAACCWLTSRRTRSLLSAQLLAPYRQHVLWPALTSLAGQPLNERPTRRRLSPRVVYGFVYFSVTASLAAICVPAGSLQYISRTGARESRTAGLVSRCSLE